MLKAGFIKKIRTILLSKKQQILNSGYLKSSDDIDTSSQNLTEDGDIAQSVTEQQVTFTMRQAEIAKLHQIDNALERIDNNCYGYCEECDDQISQKRLLSNPWTELCIEHAEERERESSQSHQRKRA